MAQKSNNTDVYHAVWAADKARIPAFHEKRFPSDVFNGILFLSISCLFDLIVYLGNFVVKVCDVRGRGADLKSHNLLKLYKWDEVNNKYKGTTNAEISCQHSFRVLSLFLYVYRFSCLFFYFIFFLCFYFDEMIFVEITKPQVVQVGVCIV